MKTKTITYGFAIAAIAFATIFSSCKKDKKNEPEEKDTDTSAASDQAFASSSVNDMTSISDEACRTYSVSSFKVEGSEGLLAGGCATVTVDSLAAPAKTITVNFGTTNCLSNDGRYRRGALVFTFSGKYKDSATVITVKPVNYFVDDNQITGTKSITNKGHNSANHLVYEISANIQIIKPNGGGTITWNSTRQREWTAGESTLTWNDDMYSITGSASGTSATGTTFTSQITTALVRNMAIGCRRHFVSGVIDHTPAGKPTRTLNYGNGACDDLATVTINGITYNIVLH